MMCRKLLLLSLLCATSSAQLSPTVSDVDVTASTVSQTVNASCGGDFWGPNGTLQSPNYPANYAPLYSCIYIIGVDVTSVVKLTFEDFQTEDCGFLCDGVELYNGNITDPTSYYSKIDTIYGRPELTLTYFATEHVMSVVFTSDFSVTDRGFRAVYERATPKAPATAAPDLRDWSDVGSSAYLVRVLSVLTHAKDYNKRVRPVNFTKENLYVYMDLQMKAMLDIDEKDQTMSSMCQLTMTWSDSFLHWEDRPYLDQIDNVQLLQDDIWTPDITVDNIVQKNFFIGDKIHVVNVAKNGLITWTVNTQMTTQCDILVESYPFDFQKCDVVFTTEQSDTDQVLFHSLNLHHTEGSGADREKEAGHTWRGALGLYGEDGSWAMDGYTVEEGEFENKSKLTYSFYLTRRHAFYLITLILPVDFLSFTSCLVFLIPSEAGGKMGTSITIVLAYAVYITILSEYLPDTSIQISQFAIFLTLLLVLTTMSSCLTAVTLHLYFLPEEVKVGRRTAKLVLWLKKVFLYRRKEKILHKPKTKTPRLIRQENFSAVTSNGEDPQHEESEPRVTSQQQEEEEEEEGVVLTWQLVASVLDWSFYIVFVVLWFLLVTYFVIQMFFAMYVISHETPHDMYKFVAKVN